MANYCFDCTFRAERNKKTFIPAEPVFVTNKKGFCLLGYTQNPRDLEATLNARKNGAEICERNTWKNY